ncbi:TUDOR domain containing protein [Trichuris trichiura]|uniref:TUDOR domain containing protein n=1 Tax=Trichuris trichiura TaxID=36087 RepID=A0A077Z403_TRITR|nr:TUDOR domain containing protein [Trichuris trichiura]
MLLEKWVTMPICAKSSKRKLAISRGAYVTNKVGQIVAHLSPAPSRKELCDCGQSLTYTFEKIASFYRDDLEPTEGLKEAVARLNLYKPHSIASALKDIDRRKKLIRSGANHSQGQEPARRMAPARLGVLKPPVLQTLKKSFEDLRIAKIRTTPYLSIPTNVDVFRSLKKFIAEVTIVYNPTYFYVVPLAERQFYQMAMEAAFNRILNGPIFAASYDPVLHGNFCCVRTAQLEFSRGYCYEFDPRVNTAKVYFIDSGLRRSVRKECILPMPRELLAIPLLAAHCTLLGSTAPASNGKVEQTELSFMKQVSKKRFLVIVHWHSYTCIVPGLSIPSLCVDLIDEEQEKPVYDGSIAAAGKCSK